MNNIQFLKIYIWLVVVPGLAISQTTFNYDKIVSQLDSLKNNQLIIKQELHEIKTLLHNLKSSLYPREGILSLSIEGLPFKGNEFAPITIIEFSDYYCPYSGEYFKDVYPQLESEYILTGKVKYVFWDFPNETIHPRSFEAAKIAKCAGDQGKYWELHDLLLLESSNFPIDNLENYINILSLNKERIEECLNTEKYTIQIEKDIADAKVFGIKSTPSFIIGRTNKNTNAVKPVKVIEGLVKFEYLKNILDINIKDEKVRKCD